MALVVVDHDFAAPRDKVFAYLSEHENLGDIYGAKIERVRDGDSDRNGVGSVRRLKVGPMPWFEETIVEVVPDELIRYRITTRALLKDHEGVMWFSDTPSGGTHVHYEITFGTRVPGAAPLVRRTLVKSIRDGFSALDATMR